ncbi:hypothetical protein ABZP36_024694 [Zizania latifolia]
MSMILMVNEKGRDLNMAEKTNYLLFMINAFQSEFPYEFAIKYALACSPATCPLLTYGPDCTNYQQYRAVLELLAIVSHEIRTPMDDALACRSCRIFLGILIDHIFLCIKDAGMYCSKELQICYVYYAILTLNHYVNRVST